MLDRHHSRLALLIVAFSAMGCPKSSQAPDATSPKKAPGPSRDTTTPAPEVVQSTPQDVSTAGTPPQSDATPGDTTTKHSEVRSTDSTVHAIDSAAAAPIDSRVDGVQPMRFPLKAFASEDQEKAIKSVRKAARWVRRGAFTKAIDAYKTALALDANSWSRYELMTTFLRAGDTRAALGVLKELREWADSKFECLICKVWLKKSTSDKLFASVHKDPRYMEIVGGLAFEEPDYEKLTRDFLVEIATQQKAMLKASLEHRMTVRLSDMNRSMHATSGATTEWEKSVHYFETFESIEKAVLTAFDEPEKIRCKSRCCRLTYGKTKVDPKANQQVQELAKCDFNRLERICFWPFEDKKGAIVRLDQRMCEVKTMGMDQLIDRVGKPGWTVPKSTKDKDSESGDELDPPGKPEYRPLPEDL